MTNHTKFLSILKSINLSVNSVTVFVLMLLLVQLSSLLIAVPKTVSADSVDPYTLQFSEIGTHPEASAKPLIWQKQITELKVFNGKLLAGYGDYDGNIGPIAINPFDIATNTFEGVAATLPSESIGNWKVINDKLYTTTIDARGCANCASGFAVSDNGTDWDLEAPVTALHIYDIETLTGTDLWLFGSSGSGDGYATAWRSLDSGETWEIVKISANSGTRYYWGKTMDGKMYFQEAGWSGDRPMEIFDGTSWSAGTSVKACYNGDYSGGPNPIMYNDEMVCYWTDHLRTFNGETVSLHYPDAITYQVVQPGTYISYGLHNSTVATSDALYMLDFVQDFQEGAEKRILRSPDLVSWQSLVGLPDNPTAMTIDETNSKIYVGDYDGKLYVADLPTLPEFPPVEEPEEPEEPGEEDPEPEPDEGPVDTPSNLDDLNNDGIADIQQPNVAAFVNPVGGKYVAIEVDGDCSIVESGSSSEDDQQVQDSGYNYQAGLQNFRADCGDPGFTTTVRLFYYGTSEDGLVLRKYNPVTGAYFNLTSDYGAILSSDVIDDQTVTIAGYQVKDGGDLDIDGQADGKIIDPVGLGSETVGAPNSGLQLEPSISLISMDFMDRILYNTIR